MVTKLKYVTKSGVIIHAEVNDFAAIILFRTLSQRKNSPKFNIPKPSYKIRKIDFVCSHLIRKFLKLYLNFKSRNVMQKKVNTFSEDQRRILILVGLTIRELAILDGKEERKILAIILSSVKPSYSEEDCK